FAAKVHAPATEFVVSQRRDNRIRRHNQLAMSIQMTAQIIRAEQAAGPAQDAILFRTFHESISPITIQRTGESLWPTSCRVPAPSFETSTFACRPAPIESIARIGSPSGLSCAFSN